MKAARVAGGFGKIVINASRFISTLFPSSTPRAAAGKFFAITNTQDRRRNRGLWVTLRVYEQRPLFPARIYELANASSRLLLLRGKHSRQGFAYGIEWSFPRLFTACSPGPSENFRVRASILNNRGRDSRRDSNVSSRSCLGRSLPACPRSSINLSYEHHDV